MIKFKGKTKEGKSLIGFGLSSENIERLKCDKPIHFDGDSLQIEGVEFVILYGETEDKIYADLKEVFTIGESE